MLMRTQCIGRARSLVRKLLYVAYLMSYGGLLHSIVPSSYVDQKAAPSPLLPLELRQQHIPSCDVWQGGAPGWRKTVPQSAMIDNSSMPSMRLGLADVMNRQPSQGCVPASERLGPFGHSAGEHLHEERPWSSLRWGQLQSDCATAHLSNGNPLVTPLRLHRAAPNVDKELNETVLDLQSTGRTAIVLRTWDSYDYSNNQKAWLRAIITELALDTGGRYQVFLLVDVKDSSEDLRDEDRYTKLLNSSVPGEFQDMALLFNEPLLQEWYPKVGSYDARNQMYQALQIFSYTFPEFDYVWQLEMDARFTGNIAQMLDSAASWAQSQPRKNLWERNSRWYISGLWEDYGSFSAAVDQDVLEENTIWGPAPGHERFVIAQGPKPPVRSEWKWGVGEPADLITFSSIIDPNGTKWIYEDTIHDFGPALDLPRRMAIISITRTSRRLLRLIAQEQRRSGSWVVSESTPETWSYLHGLKAVYVPHMISVDFGQEGQTPQDLNSLIHKGPGSSRAGGEEAGFLWCGENIGLPEPGWLTASYFYWDGTAPIRGWVYTNGSCTYALLLHPVKTD